jgi:hypothetical protein
MRSRRKYLFAAVFAAAITAVAVGAQADQVGPINFESYTTGPIWGQQGWTGGLCGPYDIEVADNSLYPAAPASFGTKSYRISNQYADGCFVDSFSTSLADEAGESTAANGGFSGGTRQAQFVAQLTFASSTGALQPGLNIQISPDRGDGARMSYLRMRHTATNLEFEFFDVQGTDGTPAPCFQCANFVSTVFGGYNAAVPHTVQLVMRLFDGPSNDVVQVYIDGVLVHTGGSWEDYYTMDTESSPTPPRVSRTVDSLLIRATGGSVPSVAGQGFLIDNLSLSSGPISCVDDIAGGHETGIVSSPVHNTVEPLVGPLGPTVHGINCDVIVPLGL